MNRVQPLLALNNPLTCERIPIILNNIVVPERSLLEILFAISFLIGVSQESLNSKRQT